MKIAFFENFFKFLPLFLEIGQSLIGGGGGGGGGGGRLCGDVCGGGGCVIPWDDSLLMDS